MLEWGRAAGGHRCSGTTTKYPNVQSRCARQNACSGDEANPDDTGKEGGREKAQRPAQSPETGAFAWLSQGRFPSRYLGHR